VGRFHLWRPAIKTDGALSFPFTAQLIRVARQRARPGIHFAFVAYPTSFKDRPFSFSFSFLAG